MVSQFLASEGVDIRWIEGEELQRIRVECYELFCCLGGVHGPQTPVYSWLIKPRV